MKYKSLFLIIIFTFIAQLFYGQEKYTIKGEFPDHSLDNEYVLLYDRSALQGESKRLEQIFIDSILVVDKKFRYEGTLNRKPFLASISCSKGRQLRYTTTFILEPGNIQIRVGDWGDEGEVSGTPINNDYDTYMKKIGRMRSFRTEQKEIGKDSIHIKDGKLASSRETYKLTEKGILDFLEKYAQYPDVIRYWLSLYIDPITNSVAKESNQPQFMHIVDLMPKADRDVLMAWREYRSRLKEYREKTKALRDSLNANEPRFIETVINNDKK